MPGLSEMLKVYEHIFLHALVERPQIRRAESERVLSSKVVKEPVDELSIEAQAFFPGESADRECIREELIGNRLELSIECPIQGRFDNNSTEADH